MDMEHVFGAPIFMTLNHFYGVDKNHIKNIEIRNSEGKKVNPSDPNNNLRIKTERYSSGHIYVNLNL